MTATATEYWTARRAREQSRKALYASLASRQPYSAPAPLFCKHCGSSLFSRSTGAAAGRCTGPLTCPNAYTD